MTYAYVTIDQLHNCPAGTLAVDNSTGHGYRLVVVQGGTAVAEADDEGVSVIREPHRLDERLGNKPLAVVWMPQD